MVTHELRPLRILFICSRNQWRSPTAERVVGSWPGVEARSAGTSPKARRTVSEPDVRWSDMASGFWPRFRS